ncbi:MAG: hypothetical protein SFW09_12130 [Hyphomicrobiaceae bacterium]|nr:hypothetical protein [Hyphomicrobiaceae bacterium]
MKRAISLFSGAVLGAVAMVGMAGDAAARCARLGFSVNDYGKDGPTKDAKSLLDKHIANTMASRGIAKYTVGKKDVKCELFLDFGVFDEHTCKAEATVCWADGAGGPPLKSVKTPGEPAAAPAKAKSKAPAKSATTPPEPAAAQPTQPTVAPVAPKEPGTGRPAAPAKTKPAPA